MPGKTIQLNVVNATKDTLNFGSLQENDEVHDFPEDVVKDDGNVLVAEAAPVIPSHEDDKIEVTSDNLLIKGALNYYINGDRHKRVRFYFDIQEEETGISRNHTWSEAPQGYHVYRKISKGFQNEHPVYNFTICEN